MKTTEIYIVHSDINENNIYAEFATKEEAIDYARRNKDELTYVDRVEVALDEDGDIIEMFDSETIWVYNEEDEFSAEEDDDYWNQLAKEEEERKEDEALLGDTTWFEDLNTGIEFDALVEKMEENEDMVECKECFDLFPKADCIKVVGVGYICPHCHEGEHCPECDCEPLDYSEPALDLDYSDDEVFKVEFPEVEKIHFENDMIPAEPNPEPMPEVGPNPEPMAEPCVGPECEAPVEAPVTKEETITKLVIDEHEAIDGYEKAAVEIEANPEMTDEEKEEALEVLDHIKEEEVEHIEELEELVDTKDEVKSEDESESEESEMLVEGPIGDFFKGLGRGIKNVGSSIVNKLAGWATNAKTLTVDSKADIIFGKDDENKSKPLFTVEFYNEDGTLDETVGTKGVAKFPAFEKASHAALEYVKINKTRRAIIRPIEDPNNFLGKTKDGTKFKALQYFQNGKLDSELNALENKVIPAFEEKLKTANLNKDIDKESVKDNETSTDTTNTKESDKEETNKQPGEEAEDPKANETNTPAETAPTETPKNTTKAAAIKKQYAALLKVITAIEAKKSIIDIMKLLKDAGLDTEDTNVSDFIKQVESGEIKSADLVDGKKVKDTFKSLRKILFKESLEEHINEEHPAIESEQEYEGADNAVVDCEPYTLVAHSEDEKPLDCKMEKAPLEKLLTESLSKDQLQAMEEYLKSSKFASLETEWTDEGKFYFNECSAYLTYDSRRNMFVLWLSIYHASEDNNAEYPERHTDEDDYGYASLAEMYADTDFRKILDMLYEENEYEFTESLKEDTHSKYAKPAGNKVQAYNNALKYAQKDNVPYIYGYTQVGNGKFFALEQPIKCNDIKKCTADFRNQYKRCSTVYVAYPDKDFITEALELDSTRVKPGDEIKIIKMEGEPQYTGKVGTVDYIDGIGQIHGTWGGCALIPGVDEFEVIGIDKSINEELFTREEQKEFNMDEEGYSLDSHDQYVRCGWCEDIFTKDECKFEMDMGWLCPRCQDALYARGETTVYLSNPLKEDIDWTKISDVMIKN